MRETVIHASSRTIRGMIGDELEDVLFSFICAISVRNRKAAITAFNVRSWGLDIHVFKFIYWQDFCSLEGDGGRKAGPGFHPF